MKSFGISALISLSSWSVFTVIALVLSAHFPEDIMIIEKGKWYSLGIIEGIKNLKL